MIITPACSDPQPPSLGGLSPWNKFCMHHVERFLNEVDEDVVTIAVGNDNTDAGICHLMGDVALGEHAATS